MIITLTLNPSMDYLYEITSFRLGELNRFKNPIRMVGGKGINAGRTASILGSEVWATGVLAGLNGNLVSSLLDKEKFIKDFITIDGETRNAITIMHNEGTQTEMIEIGPFVSSVTEKKIFKKIIQQCKSNPDARVLCLCGSVNSKNDILYNNFIKKVKSEIGNDIKILADVSRVQLTNVLHSKYKPYFIKPNIHEFSEVLGVELHTKNEVIENLRSSTLFDGISLIIVSCGEDGAIAKFEEDIYDLEIPKINLVNPTGSGDATVGGVAYALDQKLTIEDTLRFAMASGVANAMEEAVGFVNLENVQNIKEQIIVNKV